MDPDSAMRAFGAYLAVGDADRAAALFTDDVVYAEPPTFAFTGRAELLRFLEDFAARHTDASFTVSRILARSDGSEAAVEFRWAYVRNEDGKRQVFEGASFVTFRDGLIASWRGFSALMA